MSDSPDNQSDRQEQELQVPTELELSAEVIYPRNEQGQTAKAKWITNKTTHDYSKSMNAVFIPPTPQGDWITSFPRSIMERTTEGYIQYKGSGDPNHPYFPPRVHEKTKDKGHKILWAVSQEEAQMTIHKQMILEASGVGHAKIIKVLKLNEVPVPKDTSGSIDIRSIKDAYLKPWCQEYDYIRRREIDKMKLRLARDHDIDCKSDEDVVREFNSREGFYQIHMEKPVPFKNAIGEMIESPLLLDYLSGNTEYSLNAQAEKVVWVLNELGRTFRLEDVAQLKLPKNLNLERYAQVIEIGTVARDLFHDNPNVYRHMYNVRGNQLSDQEARHLRNHYKLPDQEPLRQVNGLQLLADLVHSLPPETQTAYQNALLFEQKRLIEGYVNSVAAGIGLGQSISSKDSVLGLVSDYWLAGIFPDDTSDEDLLNNLYTHETSAINSCLLLDQLSGNYPTEKQDYIQYRYARYVMITSYLTSLVKNSKLTPIIADTQVQINQIKKLSEQVKAFKTRYDQKLDSLIASSHPNPMADPEIQNLIEELLRYPKSLLHIQLPSETKEDEDIPTFTF